MTNNDIVQKLWNLCDVLRDDGINYSDYVTELVMLLFIKMVHENTEAGTLKKHPLPEGCRWTNLNSKSGINLLNDYKRILLSLSTGKDGDGTLVHDDPLISAVYADAQTRLREPRHLEQMIKALDQIDWFNAQQDGLGDLYEGLLEKNANETKSGAGQYFTPRALINTMVACLKPEQGELVQDPAAGTGGFLIAADHYIKAQTDELFDLNAQQQSFQRNKAFVGIELVPGTRRLALMNCLLHGMEGDEEGVVHLGNALGQTGTGLQKADVILANPPFGTSKGGDASITRDDLTYKTSNKQLAFLQHIYRNLRPGGRAAVVLPDNVLFEAGVGIDVRRDLMHKCNLHTILRLPTGIFYAQGVKTNVLFFTKGSATNKQQEKNSTDNVWVYDLRTNMTNFGKRTPFGEQHLKPFEAVYGNDPNGQSPRKEGEWSFHSDKIDLPEEVKATDENQGVDERMIHSRWRCFSREWIAEHKGDSLDISWLKDSDSVDAANLPEPSVLAGEAMSELVQALGELDSLMRELGADVMSEHNLPSVWSHAKLGLVCSKLTDGSHNPPKGTEAGQPMLSAKNVKNGKIDFLQRHRLIPPDAFEIENRRTCVSAQDILLTIIGALGRTAVVPTDCERFTLQRSVAVLAAPHLNAGAFRYSLESYDFQQQILDNAKGTAQKGIYLKKLRGLTVPIPPLAEQKAIADKLDTLLTQVENTKARLERIPKILKRFRQSVLAAAVSGRLTEEWRESTTGSESAHELLSRWERNRQQRFSETQRELLKLKKIKKVKKFKQPSKPDTDTAGAFKIPAEWLVVSVSQFAECLDSQRVPVKKEDRKSGIGLYPYFGANGQVDSVDDYIFDGDFVLVTEDETFYGREKPIAYRYSGKCWVNNHAHILQAETKDANGYLCYSLMHYNVIPWLSGTTGRAKLTQAALNTLPIGLPPEGEISEIVRRIDQLFAHADRIEQRVNNALTRVNNLTQSILAKAFRGELTEQWRKDNPQLISGENSAEALLARIQAERAAAKPASKTRKRKATA